MNVHELLCPQSFAHRWNISFLCS